MMISTADSSYVAVFDGGHAPEAVELHTCCWPALATPYVASQPAGVASCKFLIALMNFWTERFGCVPSALLAARTEFNVTSLWTSHVCSVSSDVALLARCTHQGSYWCARPNPHCQVTTTYYFQRYQCLYRTHLNVLKITHLTVLSWGGVFLCPKAFGPG